MKKWKTSRGWADEVREDYFAALRDGLSREQAAQGIRSVYPELVGHLTVETITRAMRAIQGLGESAPASQAGSVRSRTVPPPLTGTAFQPLILPYADSLVWCDIHVPYHKHELMERSIESALAKGIKQIILAGDFMDCHWASRFLSWKTQGVHAENIREEFAISQRIFEMLLGNFNSVVVIPGNHEGGRFKHLSNGAIDFELLCSFMAGYRLDDRPDHLTVGMNRWMVMKDSPWGDWRITHPGGVRKVPLSLAEALASKYRMNVLTAHQHYLGARMHQDGHYVIADGGHMQHESLTGYKQEVDGVYSNWTAGWVELVDGWPLTHAGPPRGRKSLQPGVSGSDLHGDLA